MRSIFGYFKRFYEEEFRWSIALVLLAFLGLAMFLNYATGWERRVKSLLGLYQIAHFLYYFLYYALPYWFAVVLYCVQTGKTELLRNLEFHLVSALVPLTLALDSISSMDVVESMFLVGPSLALWFGRSYNNLLQALILLLVPLAYWALRDRKNEPPYGFRLRGVTLMPYFIMLLILAPGIFAASFGADFMSVYPRYRGVEAARALGVSPLIPYLSFEFCYGLAFISVEFLFRGFMVLGLKRYLGAGVIWPMVAVYCWKHFQKPALETFSSIFGGFILGVIAYYSRSIYGGIIAHLGTAWMMEIFAFWQLSRH